AEEALKDMLNLFGGNAYALIGDGNHREEFLRLKRNSQFAAFRAEIASILKQRVERPADPSRIAHDGQIRRLLAKLRHYLVILEHLTPGIERVIDNSLQLDRSVLQHHRAALNRGQINNRVDHLGKRMR